MCLPVTLVKACKMSGSWSSWTQEGLAGCARAAIRHEVLKFPPRHSRLRLGRTACPRLREQLHRKYLNTATLRRLRCTGAIAARLGRGQPRTTGVAFLAAHRSCALHACFEESRDAVRSSSISEELVPCVENVSAVSGGKSWGPAGPGGVSDNFWGSFRKPRFSYRCDDTALTRCGNVPPC